MFSLFEFLIFNYRSAFAHPMPISFHCLNYRRLPHISSSHNSPESSTWGISVPTLTWYFQQKKFLSMSFLDETIPLLFTVFTIALTHFHRPKCHYSSMLFSPPLSTAGYYLLSCYYSYQHLPSWKVFSASFFALAFKSENVLRCNFLDILIVIRGKKWHSAAKYCDTKGISSIPLFFSLCLHTTSLGKNPVCFVYVVLVSMFPQTFIICQSSFDSYMVNMKKKVQNNNN